jgi:hypothetical protein
MRYRPNHPQPFALLMLSAESQQALEDLTLTREKLDFELGALLHRVNATLEKH